MINPFKFMAKKNRAQLTAEADELGLDISALETNKQIQEAIDNERALDSDTEESEESRESGEKVRCPECSWKAGLKDPNTLCPRCEGSGTIEA